MNSERDDAFIAQALPMFASESGELIAQIEQLLLELEEAPADRDRLDALFRCAHTIKGSAGVFGLEPVVAFTHHVEGLLDRLREGQLAMTPALGTLLLQSNDQIRVLIAASADPSADSAESVEIRAALVERLRVATDEAAGAGAGSPEPSAGLAAEAAGGATDVAADVGASRVQRWRIDVAFGEDTFRNGCDPLAILDYLRDLGSIEGLRCNDAAVPPLAVLDPESCHLSFSFVLASDAGRPAIEHAFAFAQESCTLTLTDDDGEPSEVAGAPDGSQQQADRVDTRQPSGHGPQAGVAPAAPAGTAARPNVRTTDGKPGVAPAASGERSASAAAPPASGAAPAGEDQRFIRVQADRLDAVINLLGELVIAGAGATMLARQSRQRGLIEANQQTARLIEQIRNGTLQLRMVPIGETFARFRRVVRDTAAALGKDVALEIVGGDTEMDKSVVERIADPLMHVVRNALDHGLETPAERLAAGKPSQGRLRLAASHESGSVVIRIEDDGHGIRRERVLRRAWERGLVAHGVVPPDDEILRLIFAPGFSTAEAVTNLSGRGVGMDVVRRNIEDLRGSVTVNSTEGAGSQIEIRLPLTLAIIDGFLVGVGSSKFIFPLEAVVEVVENRGVETVIDGRGRSCIELRGQLLPVVSLRTLYELDAAPSERGSVVVIRSGTARYGVMVDVLLGQHQTVIKPLGRMLRSLRGVSGSSILGTGEVALIIEVSALGQLLTQPGAAHQSPLRTAG